MTEEQIMDAAEDFCKKRLIDSRGYPPKIWFKAGAQWAIENMGYKIRTKLITISAIKKKLEAAIYEGAGCKMYISKDVIVEIVSELTKEKQ